MATNRDRRRTTHAPPGLETLEGRRLTASMAGTGTAVTADIVLVAKSKPQPPPPPPPLKIKLEDILVSSYS